MLNFEQIRQRISREYQVNSQGAFNLLEIKSIAISVFAMCERFCQILFFSFYRDELLSKYVFTHSFLENK